MKKLAKNEQLTLYKTVFHEPAILSEYKLFHINGRDALLIKLYHLRNLYNYLNRSLLEQAILGNLTQAEILWQQQKNVDISNYTHRVRVSGCF